VAVNWALLICFILLYRLRITTWPLRWPTALIGLTGGFSILLPRLLWTGATLAEGMLRALIALALLGLLGSIVWRQRHFVRQLAMHRGAPQPGDI
jgi:hypothetical protein